MTVVFATGSIAALQLETLVDPAPAALPPRIRVTVTDVASSTTFTLTRLCEGESWTVPGWGSKTFTDSAVDVDWVVPLNRPVTYTLSANGSPICTATIVLDHADSVIQDPIQPDIFVAVTPKLLATGKMTLGEGSLSAIAYANQASTIQVMGSRYPVGIGGQRQAGSGIALPLLSNDTDTTELFRSLTQESPLLVFRPATAMPVPAVSYLSADVSEEPAGAAYGDPITRWSVTGDLVAAVRQAAISGFVTYDEVQQLLAGVSYNTVQAAFNGLTYLDVQKDPLVYSTL